MTSNETWRKEGPFPDRQMFLAIGMRWYEMDDAHIEIILADHAAALRVKEIEAVLGNLHMAIESWQTAADGAEMEWAQRNLDHSMRESEAFLSPTPQEAGA